MLLDKVDDLEYQRERQFRSIELREGERNKELEDKIHDLTAKNNELKRDL